MKRANGFSVVEGLVIIGVLVLVAGVGFVGWKSFMKSDQTAQQTSVNTSQSAEVITTKADLEAAEKALGDLNFDDADSAEAETQASL